MMLLNRNDFERALYAAQVGWVRDVFLLYFYFLLDFATRKITMY